jgi:hypothetical protein
MPIHDWTRVPAGTFHDFHVSWIPKLKNVLNRGVLPKGYYAMAEQVAGGIVPDVLTLQAADGGRKKEKADGGRKKEKEEGDDDGGTAVAVRPPRVSIKATLEQTIYARMANRIAIRHRIRDRVVALVEVVSPGNKGSAAQFKKFVDKAVAALEGGIHLFIIDLHRPTKRDPNGIHGAIWEALGGDEVYHSPRGKPLTLVSYVADLPIQAFVEPVGVGDALPAMPLFLTPTRYVDFPLESSYLEAFDEIPARARAPLERLPQP